MILTPQEQRLLAVLVVALSLFFSWRLAEPNISQALKNRGASHALKLQARLTGQSALPLPEESRGSAFPLLLNAMRTHRLIPQTIELGSEAKETQAKGQRSFQLRVQGSLENLYQFFQSSSKNNAGWRVDDFSLDFLADTSARSIRLGGAFTEKTWASIESESVTVTNLKTSLRTRKIAEKSYMQLQGIAEVGGERLAIIDGQLLNKGETWRDHVIVKISSKGVELRKRGTKVWLPWHDSQ